MTRCCFEYKNYESRCGYCININLFNMALMIQNKFYGKILEFLAYIYKA